MRVLIVEDEPELADLLARAVRQAAWAADVVSSGRAALEALAIYPYDLMVLDLGLPDMEGALVCRRWRQEGGRTPILILTARAALGDRVAGLDAGADDYLTKPFEVEELLARLRALARRPTDTFPPVLQFGDLMLNPSTRTAQRNGRDIKLSAREYALLEYLMRNPNRLVDRSQILDHVWDDNFDPVGNSVEVLVGRVRRRIDLAGAQPLIHTVRGGGYRFGDGPPNDAS